MEHVNKKPTVRRVVNKTPVKRVTKKNPVTKKTDVRNRIGANKKASAGRKISVRRVIKNPRLNSAKTRTNHGCANGAKTRTNSGCAKTRLNGAGRVSVSGLVSLIMMICFLLAACGSAMESGFLPADTEFMFSVELDSMTREASTADGLILAECAYQLPVMHVRRPDGSELTGEEKQTLLNGHEKQALNIAQTFNREFMEWAKAADFPALEGAARLDYQWRTRQGREWDTRYYQNLDCTVYQEGRLVSVAGCLRYFDGGIRPKTVLLGWNYDLASGIFFDAGELFDDTRRVTEELTRQASGREGLDENYAVTLALWSDSSAAVTFGSDAMTVAWSPYDLTSSYDAGPQIFTVEREIVEPCLNDYGHSLLA